MEDLDDFMHQENLPLDLRFRTRSFFEYGFNHSRDVPGICHSKEGATGRKREGEGDGGRMWEQGRARKRREEGQKQKKAE